MKTEKNLSRLAAWRRVAAGLVLLGVTALFLDASGIARYFLGWLARIQLLPAIMAANLAVIAVIAVVTLLFGRIYCSVICPLGIFQDGVSHLSGLRSGGSRKLRFGWKPERKWLRYTVFGVFVLALVFGVHALVALLAPYSAYGRMVSNLLQPVWLWGNNLLAKIAEHYDSYSFYTRDVWLKSLPTLIVAGVTFVALSVLAWWNGREYCNSICPVGTALGFFSRFAMFRPVIDASKCKDCRLCEKGCKASCIDISSHKIDYSRCVDCFNCLGACKFDALHYRFGWTGGHKGVSGASDGQAADPGRRAFLTGAAMLAGTLTVDAQRKKFDGGFAVLKEKREPQRSGRLVPPGVGSPKEFYSKCTACGLCIAVCPNGVLRPSKDLEHLMQPYMSYERGYCRPECTACGDVCPTGAILPLKAPQKSDIHIGLAEVDYDLCVVNRDGVNCGNCARHCPAKAIHMVPKEEDSKLRIPSVDASLCIGCGACEYLCPSRPYSAIHVNGREKHLNSSEL
ncbi:MAG: 4Fe-4S dicluster domain-containing protein [Bacteroidales bacterium]|nr:4Fe-4S dicluster domain-containing protein [Bacteroidales bacterium]